MFLRLLGIVPNQVMPASPTIFRSLGTKSAIAGPAMVPNVRCDKPEPDVITGGHTHTKSLNRMMHTKSLQEGYGLPPQGAEESDYDFRQRVAGQLRDMGHIIEAHEAQQNARWDDPERGGDVTAGLTGAVAQALHGVDYRVKGEQQVGADIAAGMLIRHKKPDPSPAEMMLMLAMFG